MMTVKEVAEMLNMNKACVYNLIKRKDNPLPAYKVGGFRIDRDELLSWLKTTRVAA